MSIFTRIRTVIVSALTAMVVVAPGCDDGADYEALGVTVEQLEAMSAEELDALDERLEGSLLDLSEERVVTHPHGPFVRPEGVTELAYPTLFTHALHPQLREDLAILPRPTHPGEHSATASDAFAADADEPTGCDTHGDMVEFANN